MTTNRANYRSRIDNVVVTLVETKGGKVFFHPKGSDRVQNIPEGMFFEEYQEGEEELEFYATKVCFDSGEVGFECLTTGCRWNGFIAPLFKKSTADKVASYINGLGNGLTICFDADGNGYSVFELSKNRLYFSGSGIFINDAFYYPLIGSGLIWIEVKDEIEKSM